MSTEISPPDSSSSPWLESAVLGFDRWLCRRNGVFEYSRHPQCMFRLAQQQVDDSLELADGTCVRPGTRALALHLWNEHVPSMGEGGPTVAWARRASRAIRTSLHELVRYLAERPDLTDVRVIYADMRVSGARQAARAARMLARYGFEAATGSVDRRRLPHRMADALLVLLLVTVINPRALRGGLLRHANLRIFMSRTVLEQRYATLGGQPD